MRLFSLPNCVYPSLRNETTVSVPYSVFIGGSDLSWISELKIEVKLLDTRDRWMQHATVTEIVRHSLMGSDPGSGPGMTRQNQRSRKRKRKCDYFIGNKIPLKCCSGNEEAISNSKCLILLQRFCRKMFMIYIKTITHIPSQM